MYPLKLKTEIYREIEAFLNAYRQQDRQTLADRFDIHGEFLAEIYEMLDFIEDKSKLHLFPLAEMDTLECGERNLALCGDLSDEEDDEDEEDSAADEPETDKEAEAEEFVMVEAKLYEAGTAQAFGYIVGEYYLNGQKPTFLFRYFSI